MTAKKSPGQFPTVHDQGGLLGARADVLSRDDLGPWGPTRQSNGDPAYARSRRCSTTMRQPSNQVIVRHLRSVK